MSIRVEEYIRPDGSIPYKKWFDSLDVQAAVKVATAKLRMELGNTSNVKKKQQQTDIKKTRELHAEYKARKESPKDDGEGKGKDQSKGKGAKAKNRKR